MENKTMKVDELEQIIDDQLRAMASESTKLDNKQFTRQTQKTKELSNLAGKKIAIIAQQLYANEMGAEIAVPSLDIPEGRLIGKPNAKLAKLLN